MREETGKKKSQPINISRDFNLRVGRAGFEPTKAEPTDLQSAPFDRFGIFPSIFIRAESQIRTEDPEITNHVLWPTELIRLIFFQSFFRTLLSESAAAKESISLRTSKLFFLFFQLFFRTLFLSKKVGKLPVSHRSTAYPCCLPTLGGFSRSWSHRTYPAQK